MGYDMFAAELGRYRDPNLGIPLSMAGSVDNGRKADAPDGEDERRRPAG
jgi:hypothetical protein